MELLDRWLIEDTDPNTDPGGELLIPRLSTRIEPI
jgi:hypothetical protein